jgi:hypothetical protein
MGHPAYALPPVPDHLLGSAVRAVYVPPIAKGRDGWGTRAFWVGVEENRQKQEQRQKQVLRLRRRMTTKNYSAKEAAVIGDGRFFDSFEELNF